ncbi:hypothetical protein ABIE66_000548 [Peribacillus sp. B2I2]
MAFLLMYFHTKKLSQQPSFLKLNEGRKLIVTTYYSLTFFVLVSIKIP